MDSEKLIYEQYLIVELQQVVCSELFLLYLVR